MSLKLPFRRLPERSLVLALFAVIPGLSPAPTATYSTLVSFTQIMEAVRHLALLAGLNKPPPTLGPY